MIASGTFDQAGLVLNKIQQELIQNENILRELKFGGQSKSIIRKLNNSLRLDFKNGSTISSRTIGTMRGQRAKIVVIDEAPEVNRDIIQAVVDPLRIYKRPMMTQLGLPDYTSKII